MGTGPEGSQGYRRLGHVHRQQYLRCGRRHLGVRETAPFIQDNYIHDLKATQAPHYDGIQLDGGVSNVIIRHNTVINDYGQTSAVMIDNYFGPISNITVDNNLLVGGGYTIYVDGQFNGGSITGVSITNNHMGQGYLGNHRLQQDFPGLHRQCQRRREHRRQPPDHQHRMTASHASLSIAALSADKAEGQSGSTPFTFTVTRGGDTSIATSASWAVTGSGANPAAGSDFVGGVLPSGTVSFAAGQTSKTITVNVAGDTVVEPDQGFTVTLSNPAAGTTIGTAVD